MTPAERKRRNEERDKLRGYRNRLMLLKDVIPNINELWESNEKIIEFFESGKAVEFESRLTIKPGKPIDKVRKPLKVETKLTVELFKDLKANGVNDKTIRADFGMNINQLVAWKRANGLTGLNLPGGNPSGKKKEDKEDVEMTKASVEVKVDGMAELQKVIQELKSKIDVLQLEKENAHVLVKDTEQQLKAQNLKIRELEASLEDSQGNISKYKEMAEIANNAERKAIQDLINYQEDYRKLEVDFRNQSSEIEKLKNDIEYLKPYQHMSLVVMERYLTENKRFDAFVEARKW